MPRCLRFAFAWRRVSAKRKQRGISFDIEQMHRPVMAADGDQLAVAALRVRVRRLTAGETNRRRDLAGADFDGLEFVKFVSKCLVRDDQEILAVVVQRCGSAISQAPQARPFRAFGHVPDDDQ